ncbi:MAG: putative quinol monooxygenase [Parvularculaceae bacterium]|nr:antibiotic biosynthesis monooxygenase [Parvularculaceae bacterium]
MIIVSGTATVSPGALDKARGAMERVIAATRREEGCLYYSYGVDVMTPDTIVVLEYWESWAALEAHFTRPHMAEWVKTLGEIGVLSRDIKACEAGAVRQL